MKLVFKIIIIFLFTYSTNARQIGETIITTEDGIEIFQDEKYYLLKKNVKIISDNFSLEADNVKINFNKNLYDITKLDADGDVDFNSPEFEMDGSGELLEFEVKFEKLKIKGKNSILTTRDLEMYSDGFIEVDNLSGNFKLIGPNSKLNNKNILIMANSISGLFSDYDNQKNISVLNIYDEELSYIKNNDIEMYAKKINFDNNNSLIELIDDVIIIRDGEKITGDYGTLDTKKNSYKIKSTDQKKVIVIIQNNE